MQINNKAALDAAIRELEKKKTIQQETLVAHYKATRESLSPLNLIKDGFNKLTQMPGIQDDLIKTVAGVSMAFLSKKLFLGSSPSLLKKALGGIVEFAVVKSTIGNADKIKAYGISIYNNLFKKNMSREKENKE